MRIAKSREDDCVFALYDLIIMLDKLGVKTGNTSVSEDEEYVRRVLNILKRRKRRRRSNNVP